MKTDKRIINDLPDKVETQVYCSLTPAQAKHYMAIVTHLQRSLQSAEGLQRRGLILQSLLRLKQICTTATSDANLLKDASLEALFDIELDDQPAKVSAAVVSRSAPVKPASDTITGQELKQARLAQGLSAKQLATVLNIGTRELQRWERLQGNIMDDPACAQALGSWLTAK